MDLKDIKLEYLREELNLEDLKQTPYEQLEFWMQQILDSKITYPNAATISTVDEKGLPDARTILIKEFTKDGLIFYTDYTSKKAQDLRSQPTAHLLFFWKEFDRQVRIQGKVKKIDPIQSEEYFQSRPFESQVSAYLSNQSSPITGDELRRRFEEISNQYKDQSIPCPENWGGYIINFDQVEFWQGRPNRLHDRFEYTQEKDSWKITRLSP